MSESGANDGGAPGSGEEGPAGGVGGEAADEERTWHVRTERLRVTGGDLRDKVRQLVHEGNVRRIIIRGSDERVLVDIPVTAGVVGVVLAPFAVAVGAVAALAVRCTIEIERVEEEAPAAEGDTGEATETETDEADPPVEGVAEDSKD
jgi:Domain of unknown function (DUF4342)